jgi:hypothetical protein
LRALTLKNIFGKAHILLSLNEQDKIFNATDIDKVVSAEIPNIQTHPTLHEHVVKHMMHGPLVHAV